MSIYIRFNNGALRSWASKTAAEESWLEDAGRTWRYSNQTFQDLSQYGCDIKSSDIYNRSIDGQLQCLIYWSLCRFSIFRRSEPSSRNLKNDVLVDVIFYTTQNIIYWKKPTGFLKRTSCVDHPLEFIMFDKGGVSVMQGEGWGVDLTSQVPRQLALKVMSTWRSRFSIGCVVSACEKCSQWAEVSQNYSDSWSSMVTSVKHQVFRVCHPAAAMCNNLIHWQRWNTCTEPCQKTTNEKKWTKKLNAEGRKHSIVPFWCYHLLDG